ncbi:MAG: glycosyltransferase family 2 protein, partial [Muribaculaceae bacterium]|nr:glycosyltransferase family 2 protein [Muribaculaceae bacterium]
MNKDCKKEKVLVVIVTYNGMQWLERCLDSLKNQATVDAIVIDNGSTDGSVEYIRERHPEVELIATGKNLGFGAANNIGMKKALRDGYAGVYLLNQDAWIFDDTIPVLMAVSRKYPEYGILSPIQLSGDGITPDFGFRKACFRAFEEDGEIVEVTFSMAAHWYIPADALRLVGGFSPTFFHYGEDNNYVERMRWHGKKIGVAIKAKGVHDRNERPTP